MDTITRHLGGTRQTPKGIQRVICIGSFFRLQDRAECRVARKIGGPPSQARNQSVPSSWLLNLLDLLALDMTVGKRRSDLANQQIS